MGMLNTWLELGLLLLAVASAAGNFWQVVRAGRAGDAVREWRKTTDAVVAAVEKVGTIYPHDEKIREVKHTAKMLATRLGVQEDRLAAAVQEIANEVATLAANDDALATVMIGRALENRARLRTTTELMGE